MSVESNRDREREEEARDYFVGTAAGPMSDAEAPFTIMGVVNVTPDSFSDGGLYLDPEAAIAHGLELYDEGAAILDIGGESTRPGAEPVQAEEELAPRAAGDRGARRGSRRRRDSRSTPRRPPSRRPRCDAGATLVNDVTALRGDPEMASVIAAAGRGLLPDAHARRPADDAGRPALRGRRRGREGVPRGADGIRGRARRSTEQRIMLDPGIGFGKTVEHNLELLRRLDELVALGRPVLIGTSRKSFLGRLTGRRSRRSRARHDRHERARATSAGHGSSASTTSPSVHDALAVAAATVRAMDDDADEFDEVRGGRGRRGAPRARGHDRDHAGSRCTPTSGSRAAEREVGQRLLLDLRLDVGECDATLTDRIEDTVDYAQVCEMANLVAQQRTYKTLERLCAAIADRLLDATSALGLGQGGQARAADRAARARGLGRGVARSGSERRGGVPRARLERRRPPRPTCRPRSTRCPATACACSRSSSVYETEPVGLVLDQPRLPQRVRADRDRARARGAAGRVQGGGARARSRAPAASATAPA